MHIDPGSIEGVFAYIVEGLTFHIYGKVLPADAIIEVSLLPLEPFRAILREMRQSSWVKGPTHLSGDTCVFASLYLDEYHATWAISFFHERWFCASVSSPDDSNETV